MNHKIKNFVTFFTSVFFSLFIAYFFLFLLASFKDYKKDFFTFSSTEKLSFHKNYSKKLHHIRDVNNWELDRYGNLLGAENYLFTTINHFHELMNMDEINDMERLIFIEETYDLFKNFTKKNNFGLVNAGTTSYSPTLMKLQYEILKKDFNIKPNIVIAYIDQTDIGDELCRYKDKMVHDGKGNLIAIKNEAYSRAVYDYTKIYKMSEIILSNESKFIKNFKFVNFDIKYFFLRNYQRYKSSKKYGWKNRNISKCRFRDIKKYLNGINKNDIKYFQERVKDYLNLLLQDKKIEKIILITHPHIGHIYGYDTSSNGKKYFKNDVSDFIEDVAKINKKIYYLNFSKLINDGKINFEQSPFEGTISGNQWDSHLIEEYQTNIFSKKIINLLK